MPVTSPGNMAGRGHSSRRPIFDKTSGACRQANPNGSFLSTRAAIGVALRSAKVRAFRGANGDNATLS